MNQAERTPQTVYRSRLEARQGELERWSRIELWVSGSRLVVLIVGFVMAWLAIQSRWFAPTWVLLPALAFGLLLLVHERVLRRRARCERAAEFYRRGLARIEGTWMGEGEGGEELCDEDHVYARDLDLFGRGSLFQLLSVARTRMGAKTLSRWLQYPAEAEEIRARQNAVEDLRSRLDFREELWTLGLEVRSELEAETLSEWGSAPSRLEGLAPVRWVLALLALSNVVAALGWWRLDWGPTPLLVLGLAEMSLFVFFLRSRVFAAISGVDKASRDLALLAQLLIRVEAEEFDAPWLSDRNEELRAGASSSKTIDRLRRLIDLLDSRRNPMFAPFALFLLWTSQLAFAVDGWRRRFGPAVVRWLEILGELEALASLAAFSFENPEDPFPEIVSSVAASEDAGRSGDSSAGGAVLIGEQLGHPLLPREVCVRNDISLSPECPGLVVSGSNMSGKSTFLRTCGINAVLALAGAPVRATRLRLTPCAVGASIQVQDSLQEGESRFYAEILRLRQLLDLSSGPLPGLFLLDEILHGTNSHDRRIGAEAVIRAFLQNGAIGLVTTHDLALSEMAEGEDTLLRNVHFEDTIEAGKVCFDYHLQEGVVERSNAIALMREVGLDVG